MKKTIIVFLLSSISWLVWAGQVKFNSSVEEFPLFNRINSKIYNYVLVKSGAKVDFTISGADTLEIITRVIIDAKERTEYEYSLQKDAEIRREAKSIKASKDTRGIGGEEVSAYNNLKIAMTNDIQRFQFSNISASSILLKLNADLANQSNTHIEYVHFTPDVYKSEKTIIIDDKSYTYYATNSSIELTLEGPVVLKIISRLVFDSNFVNKKKYEFQVIDNGDVISSFSEEAYKSDKSIIKDEENLIPSTGDVNIIKFGKGIHKIEIKDGAVNRDIIFRFYISKSSIELEK
ncbi:MAG: hypothetical protein Q7J16_02220 [Candidatus Cloacimonadales bacterium]|nr:hypothetical protein [Candidatus Cloacimonadales bacterium]